MKSISIDGVKYLVEESSDDIEKYKIVRGDQSGVFFGILKSLDGQHAVILNARRIFYWDGAASLSELAVHGVSKPENCKFPVAVSEIEVLDCIEIISVTKKAKESIDGVEIWTA